jgi:beta-lactamase regulating signal transducer with metallopeptidase domain/5-hydroxyisourate hydrolase-like protein (transthyretin family)
MTWQTLPEWLALSAAETAAWLATWLVQSTVLILVGLFIARVLYRRGAALQSAVYRATLVGVLACPLASLVLATWGIPGWSWRVPEKWLVARGPDAHEAPPASATLQRQEESVPSSAPAVALDQNGEASPEGAMMAYGGANGPFPDPEGLREAFAQPPEANDAARGAVILPGPTDTTIPLDPPNALRAVPARPRPTPTALVMLTAVLAWIAGSAVLLGRLTRASRGMRAVVRTAAPAGRLVVQAAREMAKQLGVRPPRVVVSPLVTSPCLYGILRPTLLLPEDTISNNTVAEFARIPSADDPHPSSPRARLQPRLREIFAHELAHLRRGDCLWHLAHRLVTAVLWPQPLAWLLARRLERAAEEVCDDYAMQHGADRTRYADILVEIAERTLPPLAASASAVSMVSFRSTLAHRVLRILDPTRRLSTRAGGLAVALVVTFALGGTLLVGLLGAASQSDAERPVATNHVNEESQDTSEAAESNSESESPQPDSTSDDLINVRGRVVDPDGRPAAGATVQVVRWYWNPLVKRTPLSETKTDRDGSFEIAYSKSDFQVDIGRREQWREGLIVASKQGFGPAWISYSEIPAETEPTLRLVPDSIPIEGRLLDLEGRPLQNVNVRVVEVNKPPGDDLSGWIDAVKDGQWAAQAADGNIAFASIPDAEPSLLPEVRTDHDGRFELPGIGAERRVTLEFSSPAIATTRIIAVTRDIEPFTRVLTPAPYLKEHRVMGARFELTLPPTRPVQGVVRDAETGEPLSGVAVRSWRVAGNHFGDKHLLGTVTDEEGRYRLVGLPKGEGNGIIAVPNDDQPYFMREVDVPDIAGFEPVTLDIELHRGIWITGRVTDADTGEPVIARLRYLPFRTNRYAQVLPEFGSGGNVDGYSLRRYESKADGSFKLVGLPGPAVVAAESTLDPDYAFGVGFEDLKAGEVDEEGRARTWRNGGWLSRKSDHALKRIDPPETANQVTIDFELQRGKSQRLHVVDPDGASVDGLSTAGQLPRGDYLSEASGGSAVARAGYYTVSGLGPGDERTVVLLHEDRDLGKVLRIDADAPLPDVRTVRLEPCAMIVGRLLGPDGLPLGGVRVNADVHPVEDFGKGLPYTETDTEGRFRYVNVPVGCRYRLSARGGSLDDAVEEIAAELAVEAGETTDLGAVTLGDDTRQARANGIADSAETKSEQAEPIEDHHTADERPSNSKAATGGPESTSADRVQIHGTVLHPNGKRLAGAAIRVVDAAGGNVSAVLRTDAGGAFRVEFDKAAVTQPEWHPRPWTQVRVVAYANGFGPAWIRGENVPTGEELVLVLRDDDIPIEGRVVDLQGAPVEGAEVSVFELNESQPERIDSWLANLQALEKSGKPEPVKRPGGAPVLYRGISSAHFPSRGNLRAGAAGLPAAVVTDEDGRFRIHGLGRDRLALLIVSGPRIVKTKVAVVTRQMEPVEAPRHDDIGVRDHLYHGARCTLVMEPSRPIEGTVHDADTGAPIAGAVVQSLRLTGSSYGHEAYIHTTTDQAGRYRLVGMPTGEGSAIQVRPPADQPYLEMSAPLPAKAGIETVEIDFPLKRGKWIAGRVTDRDSGKPVMARVRYRPQLVNAHADQFGRAAQFISTSAQTDEVGHFRLVGIPGEGTVRLTCDNRGYLPVSRDISIVEDAESVECNFQAELGDQVTFTLFDSAGAPLTGAQVMGLHPDDPLFSPPATSSTVTTVGWETDEERLVLFLHRDKQLGKVVQARFTKAPEERVTLERCATIVGRVVDQDGDPMPELLIRAWPLPMNYESTLVEVFTDKDGRFRYENIPTGCDYRLRAYIPVQWPVVADGLSPQPGETLDVGEVKLQWQGQ